MNGLNAAGKKIITKTVHKFSKLALVNIRNVGLISKGKTFLKKKVWYNRNNDPLKRKMIEFMTANVISSL